MNPEYRGLIIFWFLYLGSHSFFASNAVKKMTGMFSGKYDKYYRVVYVLVYSITLMGAPLFFNFFKDWIYIQNAYSTSAGILITVWGVMIIRQSFRYYSLREFTGLYYLDQTMHEKENLVTSGILSKVRHPLYSATFLIAAGFFVMIPSVPVMLSVICIMIYTFIGIKLEEDKLIHQFGQSYLDYKREVPMLIPRFFIPGRLKKLPKK